MLAPILIVLALCGAWGVGLVWFITKDAKLETDDE